MSTLPSGRRVEDADVDDTIVDELAEEATKLAPPCECPPDSRGPLFTKHALGCPAAPFAGFRDDAGPDVALKRTTTPAHARFPSAGAPLDGRRFPLAPPPLREVLEGARHAGATPTDFEPPTHVFGDFPLRAIKDLPEGCVAIVGGGEIAITTRTGTEPGVIVPADADVELLERKAQAAGWPPGHGAALYDVLNGPVEITKIETGFLPDNGLTGFTGNCEEWLERTHARRTQRHFA